MMTRMMMMVARASRWHSAVCLSQKRASEKQNKKTDPRARPVGEAQAAKRSALRAQDGAAAAAPGLGREGHSRGRPGGAHHGRGCACAGGAALEALCEVWKNTRKRYARSLLQRDSLQLYHSLISDPISSSIFFEYILDLVYQSEKTAFQNRPAARL